jgi:hypothetical protein
MKKLISHQNRLMWIPIFFTFIFYINKTFTQDSNPLLQNDQCIVCHLEAEMMPQDFNEHDIHLQPGLSCSGCHGGDPNSNDPEEAMSKKNGFVGTPSRKDTPHFCGKCHSNIDFMRKFQPRISTDQESQYFDSEHGQKLRQGDQKVAECVGCHTAHQIFSAKDTRSSIYALNVPATCQKCHSDAEYMKGYNIPTDQYDKFSRSVHGVNLLENRDTGSPACNDCHGNHGAAPPGVASVSHVCGGCHVNNMNYFSASPMSQPFQESELHACEQCHGYHEVLKTNDEMVGVGEGSTCTGCHAEGDKGYLAAESIYGDIKKFNDSYVQVELKLKEVQQKGMDDVDILFLLQEAHQNLVFTRTLVHTFDPEKINQKSEEGITQIQTVSTLAEKQIKEYSTRRQGFGLAILFIFVLATTLFIKIKKMERDQ